MLKNVMGILNCLLGIPVWVFLCYYARITGEQLRGGGESVVNILYELKNLKPFTELTDKVLKHN